MRSGFLLMVFAFSSVFAQEKVMKGQALSDAGVAIGVQVMNLINEKATESDGNGQFSIEAKSGDMIIFPSKGYEYKRYVITDADYQAGTFSVKLIAKAEQLEEVVVSRTIMPEELGIPAGTKKYTPAERRLRTAQSSITESIINYLTGRTKYLKKGLSVEQREMAIEKLSVWFPAEYYIETLKVPDDYVEGFWYFVVEDDKLRAAVKANNKVLTKFELSRLSVDYQKLMEEVANYSKEPRE